MRRVLVLVLVALALWVTVPIPTAQAEGCRRLVLGLPASASSCGELGWTYNSATNTFDYGSSLAASDDPDGSRYVYSTTTACDRGVDAGQSNACANFANCPPKVGPDGQPLRAARFQGQRAPKGPDGQPVGDMQPFGGAICQYAGRSVPMAAVVAAVRDQLTKTVGRPHITVQPATRGLIHWPVLFSAPPQHTTTLTITRPLTGHITADPTYTWTLNTTQQSAQTGAGHRYTPAIDPTSPTSDTYYVKGTYDRPGTHPVTLTLTWHAAIHLGPTTGGLDVTLDPITFTTTATATVVSATNRLYATTPTH